MMRSSAAMLALAAAAPELMSVLATPPLPEPKASEPASADQERLARAEAKRQRRAANRAKFGSAD